MIRRQIRRMSEIKPALTAEQWEETLEAPERARAVMEGLVPHANNWYGAHRSFGYGTLTRHGIAALSLNGEAFGFTRSDAAFLHELADGYAKNVSPLSADAIDLRELADRIEALLPPDTTDAA